MRLDRITKERVRELRSNMTTSERILWSRLRSKKLDGYRFRRQHPVLNYIADFYCHDLKFIIEIDGEIHNLKEIRDSDLKREQVLKSNGYNILRLTSFEVEADLSSAIERIKSYINANLSPSQGDHRGSFVPVQNAK